MGKAVLERGFFGKRAHFEIEKVFFPQSWEEFFKTLRDFKNRLLLFYISFESGYELLRLPKRKTEFPPFAVAVLKETKPFEFGNYKVQPIGSSLSEEQYKKGFERIKRYIERGDIYQVNYTVRFDFSLEGNPLGLYESFISKQPVPYGVFLQIGDFFIVSGSMELFLEKRGNRLISKPIKGTLPKTENPERFFEMEKELAENLMITDMVRNDLTSVSHMGSVRVEKLFGVESYKTLHQLVSTVVSKTSKGFEDIIKGTFPPASVSGAPKRRAVEIIAEIEPHTREVYCGTIGVLKPSGDFACSVAIRTAIGFKDRLHYYAGGGIVWDSEVNKEWKEVLLKSEAFLKAL